MLAFLDLGFSVQLFINLGNSAIGLMDLEWKVGWMIEYTPFLPLSLSEFWIVKICTWMLSNVTTFEATSSMRVRHSSTCELPSLPRTVQTRMPAHQYADR